jgi:hypothetical protein
MFYTRARVTKLEEVNGMGRKNLVSSRLAFRAWYYFRLGYSTYLTFLLGYVSTLVTVYYLAVRNMPSLLDLFPHFEPFAVLATVVGVPVAVGLGWVHMKRSGLYSSEADIAVEANPYQYKLAPGMSREVITPATLMTLKMLRKISETNGLLSDSEKAEMDDLEKKLLTLLDGGYVGLPRRTHF